ncbi:MAG: beta-N-acetylhexosaminidase [Verrucomicrobiales bacterium]
MKTMILAASLAAMPTLGAAQNLPIIPKPFEEALLAGEFPLTPETVIRFDSRLRAEAELFAVDLGKRLGREVKTVDERLRIFTPSAIYLDLSDSPGAKEAYLMEIQPESARITGHDAAGAFYGTRSFLQLLPSDGPPTIPACRLKDAPRFGWRGMMLDVGRHYQKTEDIKKFIDSLAFHKMNVFHWHLTEDQGWRIEIKKYPKLTEVGAWRESSPPYGNRNGSDGIRYGGFYTQDEIREIVAYAKARHITVVPEIEMPGHAAAAIAAYPEFGNKDIPGYAPKVETSWGVKPYTFAPTEETFVFLENVLTEVLALFPSKYIHIGGDEAPKDQWKKSATAQAVIKREHLKDEHELQSWFIRRIEKFLASKGRRLIGWDEIQEGGLPKTATMMVWRDSNWAKHALDLGNQVVMAPTSHTYFDYYQEPAEQALAKGVEYEAIAGFLPIEKVYSFDPAFVATDENQKKLILGTQAQLWAEYFKTWDKVEYMAYPRMAALAEVAWSPLAKKDYEDFLARLEPMLARYRADGIKVGPVFYPPKRETRDGSTVATSLGTYSNNWPELAFDGRHDTFFWADRDLRVDDHFTLRLKQPARGGKVTVATGGPASRNLDKLENGLLEVSTEGTAWTKIADFADGTATGEVPPGTKHLRLRVTKAQTNWLILHEIQFEP